MPYRREIAYPFDQEHRHFLSGLNDPGEVEGALRAGHWIGITADEIRAGLLEMIENFAGSPSGLFIDSGAFGEVDFVPYPVVNKKRELHAADWERVFDLYQWAAETWRPTRLYVVAPDRVGDQEHTLKLLGLYSHYVAAIASQRVNIIVPVQKGRMSMGAFFKIECDILGLRELPIAGIPLKKDATTPDELYAFAETLPFWNCRIHLLGKGPAAPFYEELIHTLKAIRPQLTITSDSTHRRWIGRTNGPGGTRRIYTRASDEARERGAKGPAVKQHAMQTSVDTEQAQYLRRAEAEGWYDEELVEYQDEEFEDDGFDGFDGYYRGRG